MRKYRWITLGLSLILAGCGGGGGGIADSNPPVISRLAVERDGDRVLVSAEARDAETGVASVVVVAIVGTASQTTVMSALGNNQYQAALPSNTVRVRVRAQDRAGNTRETGDIPAPPPQPPF